MKVINVRGGIACNSSSSHSLLIPHTPIGHEQRYVPNHMDYGWENFTETNPMIYFAVLLCQQLVDELGPAAEYVMRGLFPGMTPQWTDHGALLGQLQSSHYVDHQSTFFFPRTPDGKSVNFEFFRAFLNWAQAKNLVILGGNDNDDGVHPLFDQGTVLKEEDYHFHMWGGLRARQDALHPDIWSLYNPKTGMKLRLWFGIDEPPATLRGMPELLDVKLTNWCNMGCVFCYQSSTIEGAHADFNIWDMASTIIQEVGPWEVALGGGEATGHPQLDWLARILHEYGTNVSITTRNVKWILDNADNDSFAAIAYSADQTGDRVLEHLVDAAGDKIHFQFVEGVSSIFHIRDVLRRFPQTPVTILGYKDVGFGKDYAPKIIPWEEHQKELLVRLVRQNWGRVRVDTAFLRRHPDFAEQFHKASWHTSEGSWSAYVDLVTKRVAPSSYSPPEAFIGFDPADSGSLRTALQQIEVEG